MLRRPLRRLLRGPSWSPARLPPSAVGSGTGGTGGTGGTTVQQLQQLAELRDQANLTDAEFDTEKAKILSS